MSNNDGVVGRRSGRLSWGTAALAVALVTLTAAKCEQAGDSTTHREDQDQSYTQPIDVIQLDLGNGDIRIASGEDGKISVERKLRWDTNKPKVKERWQGRTLKISNGCAKASRNCSVDYRIKVPAGVRVVAKTGAGDIAVTGVHGAQDLHSSSGDLRVDDAEGSVKMETDNGSITGTDLAADQVKAQTSAGDVNLVITSVPKSVTASSSAGDVDLRVPRAGAGSAGYNVQASTGAGSKDVGIESSPAGTHKIVVKTTKGDINVRYL
jgi:hypothetical protein